MNELDLFRDFRRGVAPPSSDAKDRASALLAGAVPGAHTASTHPRRLRGLLAHAGGPRRRLVLLAAGALVALVGTASAFSTVRDFILDREAQSVDYCIGAALRPNVISFRSTDGVPLHGVLLGSGQNGIVLGGLGHFRENLCNWLPFAQTLAQHGYRVLAYDSRPLTLQRRLSPFPSPAAVHLVRDVVGAERELVRRGLRRVLVGGAGPIGTAAMTAAALIPRSVLAGVVLLSAPRQFARMDAEAAARRVTAPSFFGVGRQDSLFVDEIRKLYAASAAERKQLVVVPSSGEGTDLLLSSWAPPSFRAKLLAFVAAAFGRGD
jgi:pimeloyl-ACP methyl ester carboxylesterase